LRTGFLVVSPLRIAYAFLHVERGRSSKRVWRSRRIIYFFVYPYTCMPYAHSCRTLAHLQHTHAPMIEKGSPEVERRACNKWHRIRCCMAST
jgi:hypothetical protein